MIKGRHSPALFICSYVVFECLKIVSEVGKVAKCKPDVFFLHFQLNNSIYMLGMPSLNHKHYVISAIYFYNYLLITKDLNSIKNDVAS
jgi:hypothetical protein